MSHRSACACSAAGRHPHGECNQSLSRRRILQAAPCVALTSASAPDNAFAFEGPTVGYYRHNDRLDGYSFMYPESWITVTTSGNDVFYRNSRVADENLFVDASSPSSSKYSSVADLGSPQDASSRLQAQFVTEYMSTRLGVRREVQPMFSTSRTGALIHLCDEAAGRVHLRNSLSVGAWRHSDIRLLISCASFITAHGCLQVRMAKCTTILVSGFNRMPPGSSWL
jgi:hypothetical protein